MSEPLYDRDGTARMIRILFIEHKKALQKRNTYALNPRHDTQESWLRAADACLKLAANPRDYVDAAFALCSHSGGPFSNQLAGPTAATWYNEYTKGREDRAARAVGWSNVPVLFVASPPTPAPINDSSVLMESIRNEFILAHSLIYQITGSPCAYQGWKVVMDEWTSISPYIRVAIAGKLGLVTIVRKFAPQAREYLSTRPGHVACLFTLGYNINDYLNAASHH